MPMILNPPLVQPAYSQVVFDRPLQSRLAQGYEGQAIDKQIDNFLRMQRNRSDSLRAVDDEATSSYRHVPLQFVGTIRVRFREAVPMQPRQFHFDDEDE